MKFGKAPSEPGRTGNTGLTLRETYLLPKEVAPALRATVSSLSKRRARGAGPPYVKIGRRILYPREALISWLKAHRVEPLEDNGQGNGEWHATGS